jgi:predicted dinucleotide-binding enzyme
MKQQQIGLIGAGHVGRALAQRLVELGHRVQVANSRGPQSLQAFAQQTGAQAVAVEHVAHHVDLLILAIPLGSVRPLQSVLQAVPVGVPVVDTGNYIPERDGVIAALTQGLPETAWVAQQLGRPVVKAFNSIMAASLAANGQPNGNRDRIALPVAGDDAVARTAVMALVEELGFTAFDAGPLADSWRQQPGQPAYCTDPTLAELPSLLARANRQKAAATRDQAMKLLAKLPPSFPAQELVRVSRLTNGLGRWQPRNWWALLRLGLALLRAS